MARIQMDIIERVHELVESGETFCLATLVSSNDLKIPLGRKAIVLIDGRVESGIGSDTLDARLATLALEAIKDNKKRLADIGDGLGVFLDVLSGEPRVILCGVGHIAIPLARFAQEMGFAVTVLDDREDYANKMRFPDCELIAENFTLALRDLVLGPTTYVVVITRGHEHDVDCLIEILSKETAYMGLIGSRRRVRFVLKILNNKGISQKRLGDVFTPIGTPIGAESPEEIALSIVTELVCVRRKGNQQAKALRKAIGID